MQELVVVYFVFPETKGLSLEEIATVFGMFRAADVALTADGEAAPLAHGRMIEDKKPEFEHKDTAMV